MFHSGQHTRYPQDHQSSAHFNAYPVTMKRHLWMQSFGRNVQFTTDWRANVSASELFPRETAWRTLSQTSRAAFVVRLPLLLFWCNVTQRHRLSHPGVLTEPCVLSSFKSTSPRCTEDSAARRASQPRVICHRPACGLPNSSDKTGKQTAALPT